MTLNSTVSWSPPPVGALDFSNCTAQSAYFASLVTFDEAQDSGYLARFDYLRALVPSNWTDHRLTDVELLLWYESWDNQTDSDIFYTTAYNVEYECERKVCEFLPLEGDPDLAGIGMMASYYLIAFLATLYATMIALDSFTVLKAYKPWRRSHSWFEQTLNTFLDASLLFSVSMLLAAIYRFSSAARHPDGDDNTFIYSLINAVTASMFSVFPPLILQLKSRKLRRRGIRSILWFLVIAFVITMTILYYRWRGPGAISRFFDDEAHLDNQIDRHIRQVAWLILCDLTNARLVDALDRAIITAQVLLGLNLPGWIYLVYTIRNADSENSATSRDRGDDNLHHAQSNWWKRYGKHARALNIVLCCAMMWVLLGTFTAIAVRLADAMGPWGKDRSWSIGQILAMATFAPLMIDVIAIALDEPRRALEGKLPMRFTIAERGELVKARDGKISSSIAFNNGRRPAEYEMLADGAGMPRS